MFILRKNFSYQIKLIKIAEKNNDFLEILADLFSNRFYENILIQNAENEEFIILLFYLFKQEINSMENASLSSFLEEKNKFIGKLLRSYTTRSEFKSFLKMNFNDQIMKIQNQHPNVELDTKLIFNYFKNKYSASNTSNSNMNLGTPGDKGKLVKESISASKIFTHFDTGRIDTENLGKAIKRSSLLSLVNYLFYFFNRENIMKLMIINLIFL